MAHDFLAPQPVTDAVVYVLRMILHDWSDLYCIKILRCLAIAMKRGSRILIAEIVVPAPGVLPWMVERKLT